MKKVRVLVIDSGIQADVCNIVESYALECINGNYNIIKTSCTDYVGHGTAVANIILSTNPDIEIISIRICDNELEIDESGLIAVLQYVYQYINVDIINISAGITYIEEFKDLEKICSKIRDKGILIVSAFDNDGAISFPAAFDSVIGVDVMSVFDNSNEMIRIENSIVDIFIPNHYYRTKFLEKRTIIKGTSFACAYVTGLISKNIGRLDFPDKDKIINMLTNTTRKIDSFAKANIPCFDIKKAIIFPVNKESHAVLQFSEELTFDIYGVYDDKAMGKIGNSLYGKVIRSYDDIDWEDDFDTIILSCISDLSKITKRNYIEEILVNSKKYKKQIYSFESIKSNYEKLLYSKIDKAMVPEKNMLKLHKNTMPVVAVFGTSSKQGKYTLQQKLCISLKKLGYDVGFLSTEPSGFLFGADEVFHFGYKAEINLQPWECISILNEMVWNIQLKGKDILITGCQSGIVHYNHSKITDYDIYQYAYLLGVLPDFPILCVNPHDDIDYISRSIGFINSVCEEKVKAIVIFPLIAIQTLSGIGYKIEKIKKDMEFLLKKNLKDAYNIPVFSLDDENLIDDLCIMILNTYKIEYNL